MVISEVMDLGIESPDPPPPPPTHTHTHTHTHTRKYLVDCGVTGRTEVTSL